MKLFSCDDCGQMLFFENSGCVNCGAALGYCPEAARLAVLRPTPDDAAIYQVAISSNETRRYRLCRNAQWDGACNWLVAADSQDPNCASCTLTEIVPDLSDGENNQAWRRIEAAKRRLLYTLYALKLPVVSRRVQAGGLAFNFLRGTADDPVMTGHANGIISLNVAEADFAFRENMREKMGEGYRTLLGHLRHEIGHYYWERLIQDTPLLEGFRRLFGDETQSYDDAVKRHYEQGPPVDWPGKFISAYATMHPWEDWAETWAHYMHMVDTLETAKAHGLTLRLPSAEKKGERLATDSLAYWDFDALTSGWASLTLAMNSLNRSMGMKDAYPFVLTSAVLAKLRFVHELVQTRRAQQVAGGVLRPTG